MGKEILNGRENNRKRSEPQRRGMKARKKEERQTRGRKEMETTQRVLLWLHRSKLMATNVCRMRNDHRERKKEREDNKSKAGQET